MSSLGHRPVPSGRQPTSENPPHSCSSSRRQQIERATELNTGVGLGLGCSLPCGCQSCPHLWMNRGYAHSRPVTPAPFTDAELPVTKAYSPALDLGIPGGVARVLGAHRVSADITASTDPVTES
ncbi:unnamed protein product [Caretta caretta]